MSNSLIIGLGAPRSGFSLLDQCFRFLGLSPLIHHERIGADINALIFQDLGITPETVGPFPFNWKDSSAAIKARERINELLNTLKTSNQICYVIDTLLCRVLSIWLEVIQQRKINAKFIHIIRHPWETALSLQTNHGIDLSKAHLKWFIHVRDIRLKCPSCDLITFDQILADPVSSMVRMGKELDLIWPRDPWLVSQSLLDFVQPALKQHHASNLSDEEKKKYSAYERLYEEVRNKQWRGSFENNGLEYDSMSEEASTLPTSQVQMIPKLRQRNNPDLIDSLLSVIGQYQKETDIFQTEFDRKAAEFDLPLFFQVCFPSSKKCGGLIERVPLLSDAWKEISIPVPEPRLLGHEPILIKPLNRNGTVRIAAITLKNQATGESVWTAKTAKDFFQITVQGQAVRLPDINCLKIMVLGDNPSLVLPKTPIITDYPLEILIYLKVTRDQEIIRDFLQRDISAVGQHSIGTIHHFSCSGGTVICKCLAAMKDVVLLSEINPSNPGGGIWFNPFDPLQQFQKNFPELSYINIEDLKEIFLERISWVIEKCIEKNQSLIIRDHSHSDFLMNGCVDAPPLYTSLTEISLVKPIVTLRNPIDSYLSLKANPTFKTDADTFDVYCQRLLTFLEKYHFADIFLYEDFLEDPDSILERMCDAYDIEYDPAYKDNFHKISLTGNSGRGKNFKEIKKLERRPYDDAFKREVLESQFFMELSERYDYHL